MDRAASVTHQARLGTRCGRRQVFCPRRSYPGAAKRWLHHRLCSRQQHGAVVGVWLALGMAGSEIEAMLRQQCGPEAVVNSIFCKGAAGDGLEVFRRIFRESTADRCFADLSIPATVMTANLAGRCPAPISTGPLSAALMAAIATPGL